MKFYLAVFLPLVAITPALAQDWGSGYNMGSIGVMGGAEASGTISLDCAAEGNSYVEKGAFSIFLKPKPDSALADGKSPGTLAFDVDGTPISLPVTDNLGDGFVYEKTEATAPDAAELVKLLAAGKKLTVLSGDATVAEIALKGAAPALDGLDACLTP